ncbi:MAG TPA: adenosylmethionine--8-amino-7-oxononanoate transaminase, partial [bacterium]
GMSNVPAILLAKKLIDILPGELTRVFYSDNGSTAVEVGIKMCLQYWQHTGRPEKQMFVSLRNGYHGDTIGAMSVGGIDLFHSAFKPLLFQSIRVASPYCYRCELGLEYPLCEIACVEEIESIAKNYPGVIAGLVIEPMVQAAGGFIMSPPGYLKRVYEITRKHEILLIADEVATGFMRTGRMFACEHEGVVPDILCISKGLTSGYMPLAATVTGENVFAAFLGRYEEFKSFFHGHTYTGNQLGCSLAIRSIELLTRKKFLNSIAQKIKIFEKGIDKFKKLKHVGEVRNLGLMGGIEIVKRKDTKEPYNLKEKVGIRVCREVRKDNIFLRPLGNVVVLMPPLSITKEEIKHLLDATYNAISKITD